MQHGIYIAEFEKVLFKRDLAISHASLSILVDRVIFSRLKIVPEPDRFAFYENLADTLVDHPRGVEDNLQILGEDDAMHIIDTMTHQAATRSFASSRIRDIWCMIYIGGCP